MEASDLPGLWKLGLSRVVPIATALLAGCATPMQPAPDQYLFREIGSTIRIERAPSINARGILGAIFGTGIAAGLQSKPIPLNQGTDYACKYPATADLSATCHRK